MRTVQTDASGNMPTNMQAALADPRIGVTPDGELLVSAALTVPSGTVIPASAPTYDTCTVLTWSDFVKTVAATADALLPITAYFRQAILTAPTTNLGAAVYFGPNNNCRHTLYKGGSFLIPPVPGAVYNLASWYVKGTAGDTVIVLWVQ